MIRVLLPHKHFKPAQVSDVSRQKGAVALILVVVVLIATLIMAVTSSRLSLGGLDIGFLGSQGDESFAIADGCMEEAMRRIRLDANFGTSATTTLYYGGGSCTINVNADGLNRTIDIKSTHDIYHARLQSVISLSGNVISVSSWSVRSD